jgi:hypothetical protein
MSPLLLFPFRFLAILYSFTILSHITQNRISRMIFLFLLRPCPMFCLKPYIRYKAHHYQIQLKVSDSTMSSSSRLSMPLLAS